MAHTTDESLATLASSSKVRSSRLQSSTMLKKQILPFTVAAAVCLSFTFSAASQRQVAPPSYNYPLPLLDELKRLQQAALASDYAYRQVAYLCNNIGPRLSGSPQAEQAVKYVAAELRRLGLEVQLEKVMVPHWLRGVETANWCNSMVRRPSTTQKIVLAALGGSVATPAQGLIAPIVVVNNFDELTALGAGKVTGKIVLFNAKFDEQLAAQGFGGEAYSQAVAYRGGGASAAARLGAVAALNRAAGGRGVSAAAYRSLELRG